MVPYGINGLERVNTSYSNEYMKRQNIGNLCMQREMDKLGRVHCTKLIIINSLMLVSLHSESVMTSSRISNNSLQYVLDMSTSPDSGVEAGHPTITPLIPT